MRNMPAAITILLEGKVAAFYYHAKRYPDPSTALMSVWERLETETSVLILTKHR